MKQFTLSLSLLFLSISLWSQNNVHFISSSNRLKQKEKLTRTERYLCSLDPDTPIEGSMYLEDEFSPGVIVYKNGLINDGLFFRYNAFYDEMEYLGPAGDTLVMEDVSNVHWIIAGMRKFIYDTVLNQTHKIKGFFEIIADGETRLLCKHSMVFERADPPYTALHHGYAYDRFRHMKSFYVQQQQKPAQKIKLSRDGLLEALPEKRDKIEKLWKTLKPNSSNLSEIRSFFKHLNMS